MSGLDVTLPVTHEFYVTLLWLNATGNYTHCMVHAKTDGGLTKRLLDEVIDDHRKSQSIPVNSKVVILHCLELEPEA